MFAEVNLKNLMKMTHISRMKTKWRFASATFIRYGTLARTLTYVLDVKSTATSICQMITWIASFFQNGVKSVKTGAKTLITKQQYVWPKKLQIMRLSSAGGQCRACWREYRRCVSASCRGQIQIAVLTTELLVHLPRRLMPSQIRSTWMSKIVGPF